MNVGLGMSLKAKTLFFVPIGFLSFYALFLALVLHPSFQAHNIFLHKLNVPFHYDLSRPDRIPGLVKGKARNFRVQTSDNVSIGGWHILSVSAQIPSNERDFDKALCEQPVVLYFHGNAGNRASPVRMKAYEKLTKLGFNVVAIDYRGFGDSAGSPDEQGLLRDARAAYRWILERKRSAGCQAGHQDIYLCGQSLGTGVTSRLALDLTEAGRPPKAILLLSPYTSIRGLLTDYRIGGIIPLFAPLGMMRALSDLADKYLYTRFESDKTLYIVARGGLSKLDEDERRQHATLSHLAPARDLQKELGFDGVPGSQDFNDEQVGRTQIIIAHADDDWIIPHIHGRTLFDGVHDAITREMHKGPLAADLPSEEVDNYIDRHLTVRQSEWGTLFEVSSSDAHVTTPFTRLTLLKSTRGGHNGVPVHALQYLYDIASADQTR